MKLTIVSDAHWESRLDEVLDELYSKGLRQHFEEKDYGPGLVGLGVVLMCRNPSLDFQRRVRLSKAKKMLYMDIMLDLPTMKNAQPEERKRIIADRLALEVPTELSRRRIADFEQQSFIHDFQEWVAATGWNAPR